MLNPPARRVLLLIALALGCSGDLKTRPSDLKVLVELEGNAQMADAGTPVALPPAVVARDGAGRPLAGIPVSFTVSAGGGSVTGGEVTTGPDGVARVGGWTLGTVAGPNSLRANSSLIGGAGVTFTATGVAGSPAGSQFLTPPPAAAQIGIPFTPPPRVQLLDRFGNPVVRAGITVTAEITQGAGGALVGPLDTVTDAQGIADFTGLGLVGHAGSYDLAFAAESTTAVQASVVTVAGPRARLVAVTPPPSSAVNGMPLNPQPQFRFEDASGNPVAQAGVEVTASLLAGNGTLSGQTATSQAGGDVQFTSLMLSGPPGGYELEFSTTGLAPWDFGPLQLTAGGAASLTITAGDGQAVTVGTLVPVNPAVIVKDAAGNPVSGAGVEFAVLSGGGAITGGTATSDNAGLAEIGSWRLGNQAGANTLQASLTGVPGAVVTFTATGMAGAPASLAVHAGDQQNAAVGTPVSQAPAVKVRDRFGNPVAGILVNFQVLSGGGTITGAEPVSDANGIAAVGSWTLGPVPGANTLRAAAPALPGITVTFTATGVTGAATQIASLEGDGQTVVAGTAVPVPPAVLVSDQQGNPVQGVGVTFAVTGGGGSLTGGAATSDASGVARVGSWTTGAVPGANTMTASSPGLTGSPVTFTATGTGSSALTMTLDGGDGQIAVVGTQLPVSPRVRITDAAGSPAAGVAVNFVVAAGGGSITGASQQTDANGIAQVTSWTLGSTPGDNRLRAVSPGVIGSPTIFHATAVAGPPASLTAIIGDGQQAPAGTPVPILPQVRLADALGNPVAGEGVTWSVTGGGGTLTGAASTTDGSGLATVGSWTLGPQPGTNGLRAVAAALPGDPVDFTATGTSILPGPPDSIIKLQGEFQSVAANTVAPESLVVRVVDSAGIGIAGLTVNWHAQTGAGSVAPASNQTDSTGRAAAQWTAGSSGGSQLVRARAAQLNAFFTETVLAGAPSGLQVVTQPSGASSGVDFGVQPTVQLVDAGGNPVGQAGTVVTASLASGPTFSTLSGTLTATTNGSGLASFGTLRLVGPVGSYQLRFSAPGLAPVLSATFPLGSASGRIPLTDMASATYKGFTGGLYPNGSNTIPSTHATVGAARARSVRRLNQAGSPSAGGKYVLLSIGISNGAQEWCDDQTSSCNAWTFSGQAAADGAVNHSGLVILNGARGGATTDYWDSPNDPDYDRVRDNVLAPRGVSEAQVQVVWLKTMNADPIISLPGNQADASQLVGQYGRVLRALKSRYRNLQMVFMASRTYGGNAQTGLNPEPFAYETGFAVKWVIEAQIAQMANGGTVVDTRAGNLNYNSVAPWVAWGPYFWADGLNPRSDGVTWLPSDFESDGTHPSTEGERKVGTLLLNFFKTDPRTACWFLAGGSCP